MNKEAAEVFFRLNCQAVPAEDDLCRAFLAEDQSLLLGLTFPDPAANFSLLSAADLLAFPPDQVTRIQATCLSPFRDMLLIFYEQAGQTSYKLINGMGSNLFPLADRFCSP